MSDDIRRKKKKPTKKTKAEDKDETKLAFVIEENIAKVSKKTAKDDSESKPAPAPATTLCAEKKAEQSTANVISKLVFFVSILGFIGVAVLSSTGQMTRLQAPALANIGTVSMLPNLQNIDLDLGAVERLVTDLRTRLLTSEDVADRLEGLFVILQNYANTMTADDTNAEKSIVTKTESGDTYSKDVSYEDITNDVGNFKPTESLEDEGEK